MNIITARAVSFSSGISANYEPRDGRFLCSVRSVAPVRVIQSWQPDRKMARAWLALVNATIRAGNA